MTSKAIDNRSKIDAIKKMMASGQLSYADAKAVAQPVIDNINDDMAVIAKKHGKRHSKIGFTYLMR